MIEIEKIEYSIEWRNKYPLTNERTIDDLYILDQLYAQMMGWS